MSTHKERMPPDLLCRAQIRPFSSDVTVMCEQNKDHGAHHGGLLLGYAYPGSQTVLHWDEHDRRNFYGDWSDCPDSQCILPRNHPGRHAH